MFENTNYGKAGTLLYFLNLNLRVHCFFKKLMNK
jgi:hypothetical protein